MVFTGHKSNTTLYSSEMNKFYLVLAYIQRYQLLITAVVLHFKIILTIAQTVIIILQRKHFEYFARSKPYN